MKAIQCNLCGGSKTKLLYTGRDLLYKTTDQAFPIVKCAVCGLVFLSPQPEADEIAGFYPDFYNPYKDGSSEAAYKKPTSSSKRILDAGCGAGSFLAKLSKEYPKADLYGLDFDARACKAAQNKGFTVFRGTLKDAQYPDNFFDQVYMKHYLEHVSNPREIAKEALRILKPQGMLYIAIPNFGSLTRIFFGTYWYGLDVPRHLYLFTPATIRRLLEKEEFQNITIKFPPTPKFFLQSIALVFWGRRRFYPSLLEKLLYIPARILSFAGLGDEMRITAYKP